MRVVKFGGSSLADASQIKKVCDIVTLEPSRRIVVVSAPGKGVNDPHKVTDMLIHAANEALENGREKGLAALECITGRYAKIADELGVPEVMPRIANDLQALFYTDMSHPLRFTDRVKAAGEDNCAKLVAAYLNKTGHKATYVNPGEVGMILSDEYGNAKILDKSFGLLRESLSAIDGIVVFPGFFGRTEAGETVTFPRGGSDITGAILAAAVKADVYENFTDVDYVYTVNPKHIKNPKPITLITYREMRELSYAGFNVYQEEALLPVYKAGIPVNVRNANNPSCPGTMIVSRRASGDDNVRVAGIACDSGFTSIYVSKYLMNREIGFGRRLLSILEDENLSYEHSPTGIDDLTLIVRSSALENGKLARIVSRIKDELGADDVQVENGLSLIVVVGEGMKHAVGIAAAATAALSRAGINISMISQGSSEVSMIFAVESGKSEIGVRALYEALL
jgi:aspartate kinase